MLQKYPVNICGLRDDLSGDMLTSSQRNFVPLVLAPPPTKNCFLHPWESVSKYITTETHRERTETKVKKPWFEGSNIYKQITTSQIQIVLSHCQVMPHRLWRIPKLYFPLSLLKVFLTPDSVVNVDMQYLVLIVLGGYFQLFWAIPTKFQNTFNIFIFNDDSNITKTYD